MMIWYLYIEFCLNQSIFFNEKISHSCGTRQCQTVSIMNGWIYEIVNRIVVRCYETVLYSDLHKT